MKKAILLLALPLLMFAPAASALTQSEIRACNALAADLKPKQTRFQAATAERDALALAAEEAGENWQNAENLRTLSTQAESDADEARRFYDAALEAFDEKEAALREFGVELSYEVTAFNLKCVGR